MAVLLNGIISRNKNSIFFRGLDFSNELVLLKNVQTVTLAIMLVLTKNKMKPHMKSIPKAKALEEMLENGIYNFQSVTQV